MKELSSSSSKSLIEFLEKPLGPGLLFFGRFLIIVSISMCDPEMKKKKIAVNGIIGTTGKIADSGH